MKKKKQQMLGNLEIAAFCDQLSMIVSAGIPIYEGISILQEDAPEEETAEILSVISNSLDHGSSFCDALRETNVFPKYVLDMIGIGELAGKLEEVLNALTGYYKREESIQNSIKNAVTYPLLMIAMMLAVILVLIAKVLPVFHQIYMELGSDLTGFAGAMMRFSDAFPKPLLKTKCLSLNQYLFVIVIVLIAAAAGIFLISKSDAGQKFFKKRPLALSTAASRFANCMALALSSGLDTDQGLMLAEQLVDNPYMASRIKKCRDLTASGRGFAEAVLTSGIFSKIYTSMITIGFRTGSMDEVMHQISEEYEEETDKQIAKFISVLEPTLVIILSIFIGLILISFLLPLIGIMSSIG